jgi:hypothetical protein
MNKQVALDLLMLAIFMFVVPSVAENGSITIVRVDGDYISVADNQLEDIIVFFINDYNYSTIWIGKNGNKNHAVLHAMRLLNYSILNNTTDFDIVKLVEIEYARRQNELTKIKQCEEQTARDLANRTHVNTYEWIKG